MSEVEPQDLTSARALSKVPLFRQFSFSELAEVRSAMEVQRKRQGQAILREGQIGGRDFFILMDGSVEIRVGDALMATREPFAIFGEIAFVANRKRTASVIAQTDCILLRVEADRVQAMVTRNPMVAWKLMEAIAKLISDRFVELDGKIKHLLEHASPEVKEGYLKAALSPEEPREAA